MAYFAFELYPSYKVLVELYTDVNNSASLKKSYTLFNCALINASMVSSMKHLLCSINKALYNLSQGRMKTTNIFREIVYCMSASGSINNTLSKFGVGEDTRNILVICFEISDLGIIRSAIDGTYTSLEVLSEYTDVEAITKEFEIKEEELFIDRNLTNAVVTRISLKDFK